MKNIVVTGANRGIGLALVKGLSEQGNNIYACVRNSSPELSDLISQNGQQEAWIRSIEYHGLEDEASVKECIREIFSGGGYYRCSYQ